MGRKFNPANDPTPEPFWLALTEHSLAIRFSFDHGNYAISFRVFNACESFDIGSDVGVWILSDCEDVAALSAWAGQPVDIEGSVKWDGCINWSAGESCMVHGCGPAYVEQIRDIFATVYQAASWYYDLLDETPPPMPVGVIQLRESPASPPAFMQERGDE